MDVGTKPQSLQIQVPGIDTFTSIFEDFIHFCARECGLRVCSRFSHDPLKSLIVFQVEAVPAVKKSLARRGFKWLLWVLMLAVVAFAVCVQQQQRLWEAMPVLAGQLAAWTVWACGALWACAKSGVRMLAVLIQT